MENFKTELEALEPFVAQFRGSPALSGPDLSTDDLVEQTPFEQIESYVSGAAPANSAPCFDDILSSLEELWDGLECFMDKDFEAVAQNCMTPALQEVVAGYDWESTGGPLAQNSIILTIDFYDPSGSGGADKRRYRILQTLEFHEKQLLSVFAHCLYCQAKSKEKGWNEVDESEFIYIGNSFFCRRKNKLALQRATELAKWVGLMSGSSVPPSVFELEHTRFNHIAGIQVGKPYLYCHGSGTCEHVFYVTSINKLHPTQTQLGTAYPVLKYQRKLRRTKCLSCMDRSARYVTSSNVHSLYDPGFYCSTCLHLMSYSKSGKLLPNSDKLAILKYAHRD